MSGVVPFLAPSLVPAIESNRALCFPHSACRLYGRPLITSGGHIGNHYVGSLGYADDILLTAPSLKGLQPVIVDYARKYDHNHNYTFKLSVTK